MILPITHHYTSPNAKYAQLHKVKEGGIPDDFVTTYTDNTVTFLSALKTFNDYKAAVDSETTAKIYEWMY